MNEQFSFKGILAKEFLIKYSSEKEVENMSLNPLLEMSRIMSVREILDDESCPYKAAFDTNLKIIHYFTTNADGKFTMEILKEKYLPITNRETADGIMPNFNDELKPVLLNKDETYIKQNIFAEGNG